MPFLKKSAAFMDRAGHQFLRRGSPLLQREILLERQRVQIVEHFRREGEILPGCDRVWHDYRADAGAMRREQPIVRVFQNQGLFRPNAQARQYGQEDLR